MSNPYRLKSALGASYNTNPEDVWVTKRNLRTKGYYAEPAYGITEFPDEPLIDAIKGFQRDNGLRVDGVMNPDGETERHLLKSKDVAKTYWCTICTGPHGGVYSPRICWQCWNKGYR